VLQRDSNAYLINNLPDIMQYNIVNNSPDLVSTARRLLNSGKTDNEIIYALRARNKDAEKMSNGALLEVIRQARA
jgi:hypothetical protein